MKVLYVIGLCSPVLNWIFIYFLIVRVNDKVRLDTDPNFLDTDDRAASDYEDVNMLREHSAERVLYTEGLTNYSRPHPVDVNRSIS